MVDDRSILLRLSEQGQPAGRVNLRGSERTADAKTRYEIVSELARGGVGVVHRGRDNDLGRDVALKVLRKEFLANPDLVRRFVEEAQIGAQLQHPGIVPVYELGLHDDQRPFFAMKLVKGETLAARLTARSDPGDGRRGLLAIFRETCRTVAYAHARGVIHRDLKPANVMIGSFGEVQVVDWGFAKVLRAGGIDDERRAKEAKRLSTMIATVRTGEGSQQSIAGSVMGTPAYMPPEQALGQVEDLDARSDVFCLGGVLCEILTGHPPFRSMADASLCKLDEAEKRLAECGADERLVRLTLKALAPLPKDRPADAQHLADETARYLAQAEGRAHRLQVQAAQSHARAQQQQRARRFTRVIVAAGLATVLAIGATLLWTEHRRAEQAQTQANLVAAKLREARVARDDETALAAARLAKQLGGEADALIAELEQRIEAAAARAALAKRAARLHKSIEQAASRTGNREYNTERLLAGYRAALEESDVTLENIHTELEGAPHRPEIAAILEFWANLRRANQLPYQHVHAAARRLDPSIREFPEVVADPGDIDGISAERLTIMAYRLWRERNDLAGSARLLQAAGRRHPGNYWVHLTLGDVLLAQGPGKAVEATRHYAVACALRPDSLEAIHRLGKAYDARDMRADAIRTFERGLRLDPDWEHGRAHIAVSLGMNRRFDEAKGLAERVLRARPGDYMALSVLATAATWQGDLEEAGAIFLRAAAANRSSRNTLRFWGFRRLLRIGDADGAERLAREMLAATDLSPWVYPWLAHFFERLGLEEERQQALAAAKAKK